MNEFPIGIFDSGVGGLTILNSISKVLPNENIIYLSDNINSPYGEKSNQKIEKICYHNSNFLIQKKCKLIVVACNTATTNCINKLRLDFKVPFVGVEPAIKPASFKTKSGKIGVLATTGTLKSKLFNITSNKHTNDISVIEENADELVKLIECGIFEGEKLNSVLIRHLKPMIKMGIDQLVLGCTHFPLISREIKKILPKEINVLESSKAVATQTKAIIEKFNFMNPLGSGKKVFYCNGSTKTLNKILNHKFDVIKI